MQVRWVNANGVNYHRVWEGTVTHILELIQEQVYIKLMPIPQLAKRLPPEPEFDDSDQSAIADLDDMEVEEVDPYETSSSSEE